MDRLGECGNCQHWDADGVKDYPFHGVCNKLALVYIDRKRGITYQGSREGYQEKYVTVAGFHCTYYEEATPPPITTCPVCGEKGRYLGDVSGDVELVRMYDCLTPANRCSVLRYRERKGEENE